MTSTYLTLLTLVVLCGRSDSQSDNDVRNLKRQLFEISGYDVRIRPTMYQDSPIRVFVNLHLLALNEVNTAQETLRFTAYLQLQWTDQFLSWDPSNYNGLWFHHWPQNEVWKPVLALKNSYMDYKALGDESLTIRNDFGGGMAWMPFQVFTSTCSMDVKYYPFDRQTCNAEFVAWGYSPEEVTMAGGKLGIVTDEYENNTQWNLVGRSWEVVSGQNDVTIKYTMILEREPTYVIFTVLLPVLLLTTLNVFVFILPCESGERVGYAITVFLSFAVFFTLISGVLPESVAIFTVYVIIMTAQSALICIIAIIEVRLCANDDGKSPVPKWLIVVSKIGNCKCFGLFIKGRKISSNNSTPVETFDHKENGLPAEGVKRQDIEEENVDVENGNEETWRQAVAGLDWLLAILFTVISILATSLSIGICATA